MLNLDYTEAHDNSCKTPKQFTKIPIDIKYNDTLKTGNLNCKKDTTNCFSNKINMFPVATKSPVSLAKNVILQTESSIKPDLTIIEIQTLNKMKEIKEQEIKLSAASSNILPEINREIKEVNSLNMNKEQISLVPTKKVLNIKEKCKVQNPISKKPLLRSSKKKVEESNECSLIGNDCTIVSGFGIEIKKQDLLRLSCNMMINDSIIDFYLNFLCCQDIFKEKNVLQYPHFFQKLF